MSGWICYGCGLPADTEADTNCKCCISVLHNRERLGLHLVKPARIDEEIEDLRALLKKKLAQRRRVIEIVNKDMVPAQ